MGKDIISVYPVNTYVSYPEYRDDIYYDSIYIDSNGKQIGEIYQSGYPFYEGYAAVKQNNKWGYIDNKGNVIVDFIFDKATPIFNGKAWVIYNGKTGRLNIKDMIDNNVSFNEEILTWSNDGHNRLEVKEDVIKRIQPTIVGEEAGIVKKGNILIYTETKDNDGYTWYKLNDGTWISDKDNLISLVN